MRLTPILLLFSLLLGSCTVDKAERERESSLLQQSDSAALQDTVPNPETIALTAATIQISKELLYDQYTLEDSYPYQDTTRCFQWEKIKEQLALLENIQAESKQWGILQNYKNLNGEAPLVKKYRRNSYRRITDTLDVERFQSVPLYLLTDTLVPERYGQDGELVSLSGSVGSFTEVNPIFTGGSWKVPTKYIQPIADTIRFNKSIFVDRHNQHIATLEWKSRGEWVVRSMNPATTGRYLPPYAQLTPLGMFVLQAKKVKMVYLKDGSPEHGGYAPYASRFTDGAYIHGVPVNLPRTAPIEYSASLGTTPRSHMCVRNATSHAKFIFDWAPIHQTIIFVIE